jgi:hypothetical protein
LISPVVTRHATIVAALGICAAVFGSSLALGSRSCEGGLDLYFWVGIAAIVLLLALPFLARAGRSLLASAGWSLGLAALGVATWIAGLAAGHFQILCRLF